VGLSFTDGEDSMLCFSIGRVHYPPTACWLGMLTECLQSSRLEKRYSCFYETKSRLEEKELRLVFFFFLGCVCVCEKRQDFLYIKRSCSSLSHTLLSKKKSNTIKLRGVPKSSPTKCWDESHHMAGVMT
jgi:hypothetical protein